MTEPVITEIATGLQFPEGPVWMPDGTVLCVELQRRTVDRVHPDGTVEVIVASRAAAPTGSRSGRTARATSATAAAGRSTSCSA